jgi:hypothetical protein
MLLILEDATTPVYAQVEKKRTKAPNKVTAVSCHTLLVQTEVYSFLYTWPVGGHVPVFLCVCMEEDSRGKRKWGEEFSRVPDG